VFIVAIQFQERALFSAIRTVRHEFARIPRRTLSTFVFQDITNWRKGTEHINSLDLFFKDRDHLREKWETLNPEGTKTHFEFELTRQRNQTRQ
jgi:hypothetical protein